MKPPHALGTLVAEANASPVRACEGNTTRRTSHEQIAGRVNLSRCGGDCVGDVPGVQTGEADEAERGDPGQGPDPVLPPMPPREPCGHRATGQGWTRFSTGQAGKNRSKLGHFRGSFGAKPSGRGVKTRCFFAVSKTHCGAGCRWALRACVCAQQVYDLPLPPMLGRATPCLEDREVDLNCSGRDTGGGCGSPRAAHSRRKTGEIVSKLDTTQKTHSVPGKPKA